MNILLEGVNDAYGIEMLVRAFYPSQSVCFVDQLSDNASTLRIQMLTDHIKVSLFEGLNKMDECIEKEFDNHKRGLMSAIKRTVYRVLSKQTKLHLPWGILTGIRPTKIVMELQEQGLPYSIIKSTLKTDYLMDDDKINLMLEVTKREYGLIHQYTDKDYSLYISIPFCPTRCLYCSFTSYPIKNWESYTETYLEALIKEIQYVASAMINKKLRTIYIGGGTPTTLTSHQLNRLMQCIRDCFDLSFLDEWTVEAGRPDTITVEKLKVLKMNKITRISINPQTMNQKTLDRIGRHHTVAQVAETFIQARHMGFENINMDLIMGLPGETEEDVNNTLKQIQPLNPDSLTVHALAIKRASKLNRSNYDKEQISEKEAIKMQKLTFDYAKKNALTPYYLYRQKNIVGNLENIGFAKDDKACIYNVLIMEEKQSIIAVGAGGVTKIVFPATNRIERIENVKNVVDYIQRVDEMIKRKRVFHQKNQ